MWLELEILTGARKAVVIKLPPSGASGSGQPYVLEDEALHIRISLENHYSSLSIMLNDMEVPYTSVQQVGDRWVYSWYPKRLSQWGYEAFFHNYYGIAELWIGTRDASDSIEPLAEFQQLEVLAKKLTAERVDAMLSFLATHDSEALAAFFRVTRMKAGFKEGDRAVSFLIEQLERNFELLNSELPKILVHPIAKLVPESKIVSVAESSSIDETTLAWLSENTDSLYPDQDLERALISYDDNLYSASKVLENHLVDDVDIYENQVLHGFVLTLLRAASEILARLELPAAGRVSTREEGYVSFFTQMVKFSKIINQTKVDRCKKIITGLHRTKRVLESRLHVSMPVVGTPQFTRKARYNIHYQRIYHKIISWHRFGAPDWSVQEELFSIQSVPKLFEYYVLFLTKHHLDNQMVNGNRLEPTKQPLAKQDQFVYHWGDFTVSLTYEMKAWSPNHVNSETSPLANTEAWNLDRQSGRLSLRGSKSGQHSNRCPDFMLGLSDGYGNSKYFVIDAKYTANNKAFAHYLPDLTMKYVHGLHDRTSGKSTIEGLIIVNPSSNCQTKHFHHVDFSIYGSKRVSPALLVSSVAPGDAEVPGSDYSRNLRQALTVLAADIPSQYALKAHSNRIEQAFA